MFLQCSVTSDRRCCGEAHYTRWMSGRSRTSGASCRNQPRAPSRFDDDEDVPAAILVETKEAPATAPLTRPSTGSCAPRHDNANCASSAATVAHVLDAPPFVPPDPFKGQRSAGQDGDQGGGESH